MSTIFVLCFLASVGLFIWGIISPKSFSRAIKNKTPMTRKDVGIGFGVLSAVFIVLIGLTAPKQSASITDTNLQPAAALVASDAPQVKGAVTQPVVTTQTITENQVVPYGSKTVSDTALAKGTTKLTTKGVNGIKTLTYELTLTDGNQTDKKLVKEEVTTQPVTEVTTIGTKVALAPTPKPAPAAAPAAQPSNCSPHYYGACVPIASDVDCAGGSGNGPAYVKGPVYVVDTDVYGLDTNNNGVGCE